MLHRDARLSQTTQRVRETEAEAVAFVVSRGIGLDTNSAAQDYISLYSGNAALLLESLEYIQQTANQILNSIGAGDSSAPASDYRQVNAQSEFRRSCLGADTRLAFGCSCHYLSEGNWRL